jgi:hypothetical protein
VRGQFYHYYDLNPFQTNFLFSGRTFDRPNQTGSVNWTHTFGPTLLLETLVSASRDQVFISIAQTDLYKRSLYGINYPYIFPDRKEIPDKVPTVDGLTPFSRVDGGPYPSQSVA